MDNFRIAFIGIASFISLILMYRIWSNSANYRINTASVAALIVFIGFMVFDEE